MPTGLSEERSELVTNCHRFKMIAADGKMRKTNVLDTKGLLRLIQYIPSSKAELKPAKARFHR